jgi:hypothetical protein
MRSLLRSVARTVPFLALSLALASAPPASAQKPEPAATVTWYEGDLDAARKEASERNVPLLVFAIKEGEEESDRFRDATMTNKVLPKLADRAVLLVVNDGEHPPRTIQDKDADGNPRERRVCSLFGTPSCDGHRRNWDRVYLEYGAVGTTDGNWTLPEGFVLKPDGTLHERHNTGNPPSVDAIVASFERAAKDAGPGLSRAQLENVKNSLADAERALRSESWAEAWKSATAVLAITPSSRWAEQAKVQVATSLDAMKKKLDRVLPLLTPEHIQEGYPALAKLAKELAGTPIAKDIEAQAKRVEKDKELKESVAHIKLELEGEEMWREYERLQEAGEDAKARAVLKKLLAPRFEETTAGKRAREKSGGA